MTVRETILTKLEANLETTFFSLLQSAGGEFVRDSEKAPLDNPGGNVIMRDGDPGQPQITLSPVRYEWNHQVLVEVSASGPYRKSTVDRLVMLLDACIAQDRQLGGDAIDCRIVDAPTIEEFENEGTETVRAATVIITAFYVSDSPTG